MRAFSIGVAAVGLLACGIAGPAAIAFDPGVSTPSTVRGREIFDAVGCALCHAPLSEHAGASPAHPPAGRDFGQRLTSHDDGGADLAGAVRAHRSQGPEASGVVERFQILSEAQKQDLLSFLLSR